MNAALFRSTYGRSFKPFIGFTILLIAYMLITMSMYTGGDSDPFAMIPAGMKDALGLSAGAPGLAGFLASGYYGATFIIFMMIYCVMTANQLVASLVERGSMACLLSTPVSRTRVALTQASVLVGNLLAFAVLMTAAGLAAGSAADGGLDAGIFIRINLAGFLLFFAVSGYSFLLSCLLNDGKRMLAASGLISVLFYGLQLVSNLGGGLRWLGDFTILSAFQPTRIAAGGYNLLPASLLLAACGAVLYGLGIWRFAKRDLPL